MLPGLISVGLFWGVLIYYVNKGMQGQEILPLIKSVLPNRERFLRYVRFRKQRPPTKQINQEDAKSVSQIISNRDGLDSFQIQKDLLKQMTQNNSHSKLAKTKQITKLRKGNLNKQKQTRKWVSKLRGFNNKGQIEGKKFLSVNDPNSKKNKGTSSSQKLHHSMILNNLSSDESVQYENSNMFPQNMESQKKNQLENSIQIEHSPK